MSAELHPERETGLAGQDVADDDDEALPEVAEEDESEPS